jgi:hypothetical protein
MEKDENLCAEESKKVWWQWQDATFLFIFHIYNIHSFNHIHSIHFSVAILHLLIACKLSGKNLPVMLSRESNSGLPYSKPTEESMLAFNLVLLVRRQEVKQSLLRQRENLETVRERMEAELR